MLYPFWLYCCSSPLFPSWFSFWMTNPFLKREYWSLLLLLHCCLLVHSVLLIFALSIIVAVKSLCHVQIFESPWTAARQASLSFTISWSLLKLMSIETVMPSNYLVHCLPLLLWPAIFPNIRVFSNESTLRIRWQKYWGFSISPSNEYSRLISFRINWFDLAVQGTVRSLCQHNSLKASIFQHSAFSIV